MNNPVKNRKRGKQAERAIAKKLNGKRLGILGKHDIETDKFSIEVKSRKTFVAEKWMQQAIRNCQKGKVPLLLVHVQNQKYDNSFVIMRLKDFEDYFGKIKRRETEGW